MKKNRICLTEAEWRYLIHSLNTLRTKLINEGQYYVKIQHNDTYATLYAHCSSIAVTGGQEVKKGQVIAYVGTTGNSTGNHLHFEVYKNGERTNPTSYFN